MTCANCGTDLREALFVHNFDTSTGWWTVVAPQWFKATPDMRGVEEGYCSPACSLARFTACSGAR